MKPQALKIIKYPDPRLRKKTAPVAAVNDNLRQIVARMFELMREQKGVGLAAPQVGIDARLFIVNHTGLPEDDRVYINPVLSDLDGSEEGEEGCLSIPDLHVKVVRATSVTIRALDLEGNAFEQQASGFITRVWQHENDHLDGRLITYYMGPVAKLANRKRLKELEEEYAELHPAGAKKKG